MDETNLPRLNLRPRKKQARTTKQDTLPQLHLKQRQSATQKDIPHYSTSSQKYTPGYQEQERYQPQGGQSRLGKDTQTGQYIDVSQASRRQGLYITCIQGTGKSVLIENLIIQDIKQNMGVCLLDPHGDLTQAVLSRLPDRRIKDVIYLDISDFRYPFGINPFVCSDPTNPFEVQKIVDQVRHIFEKLLGVSRDTPLLLDYLKNCTRTLIANPGYTMADIPMLLQDAACRRKLVANVSDIDVQRFWRHHDQKKPTDQIYEISSTLRRVDEFLQPISRPIVGQSTSTIDMRNVMDEGKILMVKLDTAIESVTSLIGSLIIASTLNAAKSRADLPVNKRRQFNLYADEFQRFATEDFATLLEEARKFGIGITIAHQNGSQLDANLRERARSVANLIVFKVNSKDADELAGEFDITPQEAWEEELEEEWVEVLRPQRHERKEEQVEVEVEEDIEEITQNPVEYLKSARGTHSNAKVRSSFLTILPLLKNASIPPQYRNLEATDNLLFINTLLTDVMEHRLAVQTEEFARRVAEFVIVAAMDIGWMTRHTYATLKLHIFSPLHSIATKNFRVFLSRCIYELVTETIDEKTMSEELARLTQELGGSEPQEIAQLSSFITNLIVLCQGLYEEPLRAPTGKKQLVKRIQPHITYLTHESEKITHPRKTIMHPQRTYADVHNEVASQLANLPVFTARVRISTEAKLEEHTLRTLDPKLQPDKPLFGQALQERIETIQAQNRTPNERGISYCRPRQAVEDEIKQRQEQCSQPQIDEPPISRHPHQKRLTN